METMRKEIPQTAKRLARQQIQHVEGLHLKAFLSDIKSAIGVDLRSVLSDTTVKRQLNKAVSENVKLIKSIPEKYHARVERILKMGYEEGKSRFSVRKLLVEEFKISERRARFIARDQTSKLMKNLDRIRQEEVGVDEYTWNTAGDDKVRPSHRANSGKTFKWSSPPPETGHPGEDIGCRCGATPNLDAILGLI